MNLEVWQIQGLRLKFSDVWQGKELEEGYEVKDGARLKGRA